MRAQPYELLIW